MLQGLSTQKLAALCLKKVKENLCSFTQNEFCLLKMLKSFSRMVIAERNKNRGRIGKTSLDGMDFGGRGVKSSWNV